VAERDVGHLMGDDAGELSFVVGGGDEAGVDINGSAREREGIDVLVGDQAEGKREPAGMGGPGETLADLAQVVSYLTVVDDGQLAFNLRGGFLAELDILLSGEEVPAGFGRFYGGQEDGGEEG